MVINVKQFKVPICFHNLKELKKIQIILSCSTARDNVW